MASLKSIASFIAERAGKTRDIAFIRSIEDLIVIERARFLANTLSKDPGKARFYLSKIKVELKKIDVTDECEDDIDPKCADKAYVSREKVPLPIQFGVHPFEFVGSIGGAKAYGWTTFATEPLLRKRFLVGAHARWTYISERLYVFNKEIDYVQVEGVFPDPRKIKKFQSCDPNKKVCWAEEQEGFVEDQIAELIIQDIFRTKLRMAIPDEEIQVKTDKNV